MQITETFWEAALHSFPLHLRQESHEVLVMEGDLGLVGSPEVKVTHQFWVYWDLPGHQRMRGREATLSQKVSLSLDIHLMLVAKLLIKIGGEVEQKSVGGT